MSGNNTRSLLEGYTVDQLKSLVFGIKIISRAIGFLAILLLLISCLWPSMFVIIPTSILVLFGAKSSTELDSLRNEAQAALNVKIGK